MNKFIRLILIISCVLSLTACNLKFVVEKEPVEPQQETEPVEETDVIVNNPVQEGNFGDNEESDKQDVINTTDNQKSQDEQNQNAQNNISTTGNQSSSAGSNDNSTQMVNGITFIKLDPAVTMYAKGEISAFSNATMTRLGETLSQNAQVSKTAESEDKTISQIKTSAGRVYYVPTSDLSTTITEVKQPETQTNNQAQQNNNQNNSNSSSNSNNSYSNTGNNSSQQTQPQQPACSGVCWPGGSPDTTISGIGCKLYNFTATLTAKTYIYASPTGANQLEWLASGETVNVTAICQNNYVQVLLANGQYVYIDGNYLRR